MSAELSFALMAGAVLGASAHRAGLCTVKAVAEVMTTGRGHILWSFLKASLWTAGILALAGPAGLAPDLAMRPITVAAIVGGVIFGLGAGLNGACAISTLTRLADGHVVMLFTLAGWVLGMIAVAGALPRIHVTAEAAGRPVWLILLLTAWMLWEMGRLIRRARDDGLSLLAAHWPLSLAVLLLSLANAFLLLIGGPWSFTATVLCATHAAVLDACEQGMRLWLISLAAVTAMALSARLRHSFRLRGLRAGAALRHLMGGAAMGAGAALIPGGNDGLIFFGLPALSPHALPTYVGIVFGTWLALETMRRLGRPIPRIACESDICKVSM